MHDELDGEAHGHDEVYDRDGVDPHAVAALFVLVFRWVLGWVGGRWNERSMLLRFKLEGEVGVGLG